MGAIAKSHYENAVKLWKQNKFVLRFQSIINFKR